MADRDSVPTAPGRVPLLGHIVPLRKHHVNFMSSLRRHGDLVRIYLGRLPVYAVNSPRLIHRVLVSDRDCFEKGMLFDKTRPVIGNGLVTSNGEFHTRQRRLIQPAFRPECIAGYGEHMTELAHARVDAWRPGDVVAVDREMRELTLGVVSRTLFASKIGQAAADEVQRALPIVVKGFIRRAASPTPLLEALPTRANRRFDAARAELRQIVDDIIRSYRAEPADHNDLLSMLIWAHGAGGGMSDEQLRDELITMMLAGTDTAAITLAWVFYELGRHPEVERRVHAELREILAGRRVTSVDAQRLDYTMRVITEALRLRTPPWIFMRRSLKAVELGGVSLPADSELVISPAALHRDPTLFSSPLTFDPDRWRPDRGQDVPRTAFIPFGTGDRKCIGDSYAMLEMTIVVAAVVSRYRMAPAPGSVVREVAGTLLRPSSLNMIARVRAASGP